MGHTTPLPRRIALLAMLVVMSAIPGAGSVNVPRQEGHFVFTAAWPEKGAAGKKSRIIAPLRVNDPSGLVGGMFITVDWWTLFGEPVESYIVEWTGSGKFQVRDSSGATVTVTREDLARYPDLQQRFAQLKPKAMDFIVGYQLDYSGVLSSADRATLNRRYRNLRRSSETHYDAERLVKNDQFLFAGAGATPLSVPGSQSWKDFVSSHVTTNYGAGRWVGHQKELIADILKRAKSIDIEYVRVVRLEPPEAAMRAIADKLRLYREGKADPTPLEQIAAAEKQEVPAYAAKDEWAEANKAPAPPAPPVPRGERQGDRAIYYFYNADGTKAFPTAFRFAKGFWSFRTAEGVNHGYAEVSQGERDPHKRSMVNYIDLKGNLVFPSYKFGNDHVGDGFFRTGSYGEGQLTHKGGFMDMITGRTLLPENYSLVVRHDNKDGAGQITTYEYVYVSEPKMGNLPGTNRQGKICSYQVRTKSFRLDLEKRTLTLIEEKLLPPSDAEAGYFYGLSKYPSQY